MRASVTIRCFEYTGRFYVQEGNKRVSVLKYFEAGSVTGNVTRVVPKYDDTPEVRLYYEFMHYYPLIQTYLFTFTKPGSYGRLQKAMGKGPDEKWTAEDRSAIMSLYNWVEKAYTALGGDRLRATVGDVLLLLLRLYSMEELAKASPIGLWRTTGTRVWVNSSSRVRIPPSPPKNLVNTLFARLFYFLKI